MDRSTTPKTKKGTVQEDAPYSWVGSNYLGAMRIAIEMIDMSDSYSRLLQLLEHVNGILHGDKDKIEAIFPPPE